MTSSVGFDLIRMSQQPPREDEQMDVPLMDDTETRRAAPAQAQPDAEAPAPPEPQAVAPAGADGGAQNAAARLYAKNLASGSVPSQRVNAAEEGWRRILTSRTLLLITAGICLPQIAAGIGVLAAKWDDPQVKH
eukprot:scaffold362_cov246-Pinguiococcus_pyrenoidosus.AAC.2